MELDRSQGGGLELEPADKTTIDWEQAFIDLALNFSSEEIKFVPNAVKSFSDVRDVTFHRFISNRIDGLFKILQAFQQSINQS